jgi:CRP-like cAMP-binding protein
MVNVPAVLGAQSMPFNCFMLVAGSGFQIDIKIVAHEFDRSAEFRQKIFLFFQAQLMQTSQTAACNRRHGIGERLSRWLLTCHDRTGSEKISLTHEDMGRMLGASRSTVTLAAGELQKKGSIEYARGRVKILDRVGLEAAACECYGIVRGEVDRLDAL